MWVVSRMRVNNLARFGWVTLAVSVVMLAAVPLVGVAVKGAQRWLDFGLSPCSRRRSPSSVW